MWIIVIISILSILDIINDKIISLIQKLGNKTISLFPLHSHQFANEYFYFIILVILSFSVGPLLKPHNNQKPSLQEKKLIWLAIFFLLSFSILSEHIGNYVYKQSLSMFPCLLYFILSLGGWCFIGMYFLLGIIKKKNLLQ